MTESVGRYKLQQLKCAVLEPPWETSLAWADAHEDLPQSSAGDLDRLVAAVLMELFDDGLVYFYEADDFGQTYSRHVPEDEGLPREKVVGVLSLGSSVGHDGRIKAPWLLMRATSKGRDYYFAQHPQDAPETEDAPNSP